MLLREAVATVPDRSFARRVAIATGILTAVAIGGVVVVTHDAKQREPPHEREVPTILVEQAAPVAAVASDAEVGFARQELKAYAVVAFPRWVTENPARACPLHLLELNRHEPALHAVDPWGMPYQFLCGDAYGSRLTTRSAGPDRAYDTSDDLSSDQP